MNLDQATQNIDILIQNTRMTRQEHVELRGNLQFLVAKAKLADEYEDEKKSDMPPIQKKVSVKEIPVTVKEVSKEVG